MPVFVCLCSRCNHATDIRGPYGLWDSPCRLLWQLGGLRGYNPTIHKFYKNFGSSQNSRRRKGDMTQVPYCAPTNMRRHSTKFTRPGDLVPGMFATALKHNLWKHNYVQQARSKRVLLATSCIMCAKWVTAEHTEVTLFIHDMKA